MKSVIEKQKGLQLVAGRYQLQGVDLLEVGEQFGLPAYIYDGEKIRSQYEALQSAFQGLSCKIKYPVKALSNINILRLIKKLGGGLDTVSIQEVELGLRAGFDPGDIIFTPNCVSFDEIKEAVELGVIINIDNISILDQFGHEYGSRIPCCIRFNPHIYAGGNSKIQTGHIDSKFGISVFQHRHVQRIVKANELNIIGLHVHTGSDILNAESYLQSANIIFDMALEYENIEFIDFGSGFKVPYKEGDVLTDINDIGQHLKVAYQKFTRTYKKEVEVWFEPGKYLVSESGFFLVRTNVIKPTPATVFVGVDSGLNHFIRPMMYDSYHHIVNVSNPEGKKRIYTVVGYICETDTFASDRKINEVHEGDVLMFQNAGAYGYMMSSNYNSRYRPAEVLIWEGKAHLIRKRETFEDLLRNQIEIDSI